MARSPASATSPCRCRSPTASASRSRAPPLAATRARSPSSPKATTSVIIMKNIRWKVFTVIGVFVVFFLLGVYPILANRYGAAGARVAQGQAAQARPRLQGRRAPRAARPHRRGAEDLDRPPPASSCATAASAAGVNVTAVTVTVADRPSASRACRQDRDAEFRRVADEIAGTNYDRNPAPAAPTTSRCGRTSPIRCASRPSTQAQRDDRAPRQRAGRLRAEHLACTATPATSCWSSCPASSDVARAKEIIRSTAQLELKIVEAGPASTQEALLTQHGGKLPDDMEVDPGRAGGDEAARAFYLVQEDSRR